MYGGGLWEGDLTIGLIRSAIGTGLLYVALKDLPVGVAYAVWVGIGTVGVTVAGMVAFGDQTSWHRIAFLGLIVVGVVGLNLAGQ